VRSSLDKQWNSYSVSSSAHALITARCSDSFIDPVTVSFGDEDSGKHRCRVWRQHGVQDHRHGRHLTYVALRSECPPNATYNYLFSFIAVSFPAISIEVPFLHIPPILFFIGKHFGTGVILATAFIHLLDEAFRSLQNPVIEHKYGNFGKWAGLIMCVHDRHD